MVASSKSTHQGSETTLRQAWLAALGLCAIARREAATAAGIAQEEAIRLRRQGGAMAEDALNIARGWRRRLPWWNLLPTPRFHLSVHRCRAYNTKSGR